MPPQLNVGSRGPASASSTPQPPASTATQAPPWQVCSAEQVATTPPSQPSTLSPSCEQLVAPHEPPVPAATPVPALLLETPPVPAATPPPALLLETLPWACDMDGPPAHDQASARKSTAKPPQ